MMIRKNSIHNFPVTVEDIGIVEKIFCPYAYMLKGRTMRKRPKFIVGHFIEITR